jgi:hypothetical protein
MFKNVLQFVFFIALCVALVACMLAYFDVLVK